MLRKIVTSSLLLSAAPVAAKDTKAKDEPVNQAKKYKPQELPIYSTIYDDQVQRFLTQICPRNFRIISY